MWRDLEGVNRGGDAIVVGAGEGVRAIRATTIQTQIHGLDTLFVMITCLQGINEFWVVIAVRGTGLIGVNEDSASVNIWLEVPAVLRVSATVSLSGRRRVIMKQVALNILKGMLRLRNIASKFGSRLTFVYNRLRLRMYSEGKRA